MRYCYNCNRITRGEPIFCSFCGRTYNQKLCSRMHPNPRRAQFCSQCGSAEFSTPQPVIPILLRPAFWFLKLSPRLVVPATLVILIAVILHLIVTDPYVQCRFIVLVFRPLDYVTKLVSGLLAGKLPLDGNPVAIHATVPSPSLLAQASDVSDSAFA